MAEDYAHHVCTHEEARALVDGRDQQRFWVSDCGCRNGHGTCGYSRHDVCLGLEPNADSGGGGKREIDRAGVEEVLREVESKHLVARPYHAQSDGRLAGFCFCCPDCCAYFQHPGEWPCGKGAQVERTDAARCSGCGDCVEACYFHARSVESGEIEVDHEACYGCGLCRDACPAECIEMVARI